MLQVDGLTVRFGGLTALDDVSLTVAPGEVVGVIGPNGAGKTTLFNVICGFVRADAGSVRFGGDRAGPGSPARARPARDRPHAAGRRAVRGADRGRERDDRGRAPGAGRASPPRCSASPAPTAPSAGCARSRWPRWTTSASPTPPTGCPGSLPYGVQKRVALARALVARPRLLLLDEPAGGLDEDDMAELGERIRALTAETSVLLVEHHMDLVMAVCDRVVVLDFGRRLAEGEPAEIQVDPRVLDAYLGVEVDAAH